MALKFPGGLKAIQDRAEGTGKGKKGGRPNFVKMLRLKGGESEFVLFTTPIEENSPPEIPMHRFVKVPKVIEGTQREFFENFVCRKSPAWEDENPDLHCILCDEMGHEPDFSFAAVAVLLDPVYKKGSRTKRIADIEDFEVKGNVFKRQDGSEIFYPEWVLVYQAASNFFGPLTSVENRYGDITEYPIIIDRVGDDTNTSYTFSAVNTVEKPDLSDMSIPTVVEVAEMLGSTERYDEFFGEDKIRLQQSQPFKNKGKDKETTKDGEEPKTEGSKFDGLRESVQKGRKTEAYV
jgi:hypothetical protein